MSKEIYHLTFFDELGDEHQGEFKTNEYHNLMELLFDKYLQDWGECKGRAWCGTCHIQILEGQISDEMNAEEKHTLSIIDSATKRSRLACQILLNADLDGIVFKIEESL
ncbi:2Fe-2S iron-sulfur cluster-binding protein [Galbibacter sp.]|jgi:2Fe-2S ferredoxin|uniref:2Fe-2S iron-sulfur cluster-binding protein n=1 Tax=Galbibacter sp. TaxID=2918471 RepID=UPI003A9008DD